MRIVVLCDTHRQSKDPYTIKWDAAIYFIHCMCSGRAFVKERACMCVCVRTWPYWVNWPLSPAEVADYEKVCIVQLGWSVNARTTLTTAAKKRRRLAAPQNSQITTIVTDCGEGHKNSDVPV